MTRRSKNPQERRKRASATFALAGSADLAQVLAGDVAAPLPAQTDHRAFGFAMDILIHATRTVLAAQVQSLTPRQVLESVGGRERLEWAVRVAQTHLGADVP